MPTESQTSLETATTLPHTVWRIAQHPQTNFKAVLRKGVTLPATYTEVLYSASTYSKQHQLRFMGEWLKLFYGDGFVPIDNVFMDELIIKGDWNFDTPIEVIYRVNTDMMLSIVAMNKNTSHIASVMDIDLKDVKVPE